MGNAPLAPADEADNYADGWPTSWTIVSISILVICCEIMRWRNVIICGVCLTVWCTCDANAMDQESWYAIWHKAIWREGDLSCERGLCSQKVTQCGGALNLLIFSLILECQLAFPSSRKKSKWFLHWLLVGLSATPNEEPRVRCTCMCTRSSNANGKD